MPKDSTEKITGYLFYNEKGQLICDSAASGTYTQKFTYDISGGIIENVRLSFDIDTIIWERTRDTVFCFITNKYVKSKKLYFVILENKQKNLLKLFMPLPDGKMMPYSESKYDNSGFLTEEIYFGMENKIWLDFKYKNDKKGLFTVCDVSSETESNAKSTKYYEYEYYK